MEFTQAFIRTAQPSDILGMLTLAEKKRQQYQEYQPVFWHVASDAQEKQRPYFEHLMTREDVIILVYQTEAAIEGFIIATPAASPPVYDPGGTTWLIDDFYVPEHLWQTAGSQLLAETLQQVRQRGAVQAVVVCGYLDQPKRAMLAQSGFGVATEWYVQSLK